ATVTEHNSGTVSGSFADVDSGDAHRVTIDWRDGSPVTTIDLAAGAFAFQASHDYDDDPQGTPDVYDVRITVSDGTAGDTADAPVGVTNIAPVATLNAPASV